MASDADRHYELQNRINLYREEREARSRALYRKVYDKRPNVVDYQNGRVYIGRSFNKRQSRR